APVAALRNDSEHDRHAPARGPEDRREQLELAVARRGLPSAALVAAVAVERDALAGDRTAVEIERDREIERRVAQEPGQAFEREERLGGRADDDPSRVVLA